VLDAASKLHSWLHILGITVPMSTEFPFRFIDILDTASRALLMVTSASLNNPANMSFFFSK